MKLIHWFRQDLRLNDNPALFEAAKLGQILPIYILDTNNIDNLGSVTKWWLHNALLDLNESLKGNLRVYSGDPYFILSKLIHSYEIRAVYWNRCYEPWQIKRDQYIKLSLKADGIEVKTYNGFLLWEPFEILKPDNTPYKVFTHYYLKGCLKTVNTPTCKPANINFIDNINDTNINELKLLPKINWYNKLQQHWNISEKEAHNKLDEFIKNGLNDYKLGRNFPAKNNISKLSPYLHFGQISPHYIWHNIKQQEFINYTKDTEHFCSEIGWREFSYYLLYHFPKLDIDNLNNKFDKFPWYNQSNLDNFDIILKAWQKGETGIPIIDAGMRELWQTGYVHNRVRMITASFLVKNLLIHWHYGKDWFFDCLVDADLANNSASWQWVAGCGADAAPYFRIFNPITQAEKFDPDGAYIRKFIPELQNLPSKYLFYPMQANASELIEAKVFLGKNYPYPIVDLKTSREKALAAFTNLKN